MDKAALANFLVGANAFAPFRFINRGKLLVLMYHRFSDGEEFGKTSRKTFETHLRYIKKNYKVISLSDAVSFVKSGRPLPSRSAVITIDDGYRDFYEIAFPVLKDFGCPAILYAVTDFVDGKIWIWTDIARFVLMRTAKDKVEFNALGLSIDERLDGLESRLKVAGKINFVLKKMPDHEKDDVLAELARSMSVEVPSSPPDQFGPFSWENAREMERDGIEIGSHTRSHPILTIVDAERLGFELESSRTAIQNNLQKEHVHFCYPNGNVSQRERDAAEAAGYVSAVTTEIRLCENGEDKFLIPRIDAEPEMHRFVQATSGFDRIK